MKEPTQQNTYIFDLQDGRELARLVLQDNLFNEIIPRFPPLQFEPYKNDRILDVACGPGGWALQVAQAFPEVSVVGVDISPQMIQYARAQTEARGLDMQFRLMDITKLPWDFPDAYFDLVNTRFVTGCLSTSTWPSFLQECWRVLKPGGVMRNVEAVHMSAPTSPAVMKLSMLTYSAMHKIGVTHSPYDMAVGPVVAKILKQVGFVDVAAVPYMVDLSYDAPLHDSMGQNLSMAATLLKSPLTRLEGISEEDFEALRLENNQQWEEPAFCCHWHLCGVSGKKR